MSMPFVLATYCGSEIRACGAKDCLLELARNAEDHGANSDTRAYEWCSAVVL